MKRKNYIYFVFLLIIGINRFAFAQGITDNNFATAIRALYPSLIEASSNALTPAAATYTGVLDFSGWGNAIKSDGSVSSYAAEAKLSSIEGIVFFGQLKGLDVSDQALLSLPAVSNTVVFINASNNQISKLPSSLPTALEYMRLSRNKLVQLVGLPNSLRALKADDNQLSELPALPASLAYLDVSFNKALACLPVLPEGLATNALPTSNLTNYVFSSNPTRRLDFTYTAVRCISHFFANAWGYQIVAPTTPGLCSETPTYRFSVGGTSANENKGTIHLIGTLPSTQAKIAYRIDGGAYDSTSIFSGLSAGNHLIEAMRKSESPSCVHPSSSITIQVPVRTARSIHVSPKGNDESGEGSLINPYKTIGKALETTFSGSGDTVRLAPGMYIENNILTIPNEVSLVGESSKNTFIRVNYYYNPFDYPTSTSNPDPLWRNYDTNFNYFSIQLQGGYHVLKGFSIHGQEKKCLGAIYGSFAPRCLFEDLNIQNFLFSAMVLLFADYTTITNCFIKNSTYGTYVEDKACIFIDGENILIKKNTILLDDNKGGYGIKNIFPLNVQFFQVPDLVREKEYFLNITIEDNTILVNSAGYWNQFQAPGFTFENFATCKNCVIKNNVLNNVLSLVDAGPHSNGDYYSGSRYNIHGNTFNLYEGSYTVESMAPNIEFHHNYIFGGGGLNSFAGSSPNDYYDGLNYHHNIFYYQKGIYPLSGWGSPPKNFKFNHNTIIDYRGSSIYLGNNAINRNMEIKNNIFANIDPSITSIPSNQLNQLQNTNSVISNNLFFNIAPYGTNSIIKNPQISVAGMKPYTYFRLKRKSPAIDAGLLIPGTNDGYKGTAPDLGAYESTSNGGGLSIGTNHPEFSAALDVLSNTQGLLIPRLNLTSIQSMASPAEGLIVFCADCTPSCFYYSDGTNWQKQVEGGIIAGTIDNQINTTRSTTAIGTITPEGSSAFQVSSTTKGLLLPRVATLSDVLEPKEGLLVYLKSEPNKGIYFYNGNGWQKAFKTAIAFGINAAPATDGFGGIGINTMMPHPSAALDINTTTKGLLAPRLGKTEMTAIKSPALGLLVYCHDCPTKGYYYNNGNQWQGATITAPSIPLDIKAKTNGSSEVRVSFTAPQNNGGNLITSYTIVSKPDNQTITTSSLEATFTNLQAGITYVFLLTANNGEGSSEQAASNPVIIGVPDLPMPVFAFRGVAAGTAEVHFTPPSNTGNGSIINYTVTQMPNNKSFTATESPFVVTGLDINSTYTFTVKANNSIGASLPALTNSIIAGNSLASNPNTTTPNAGTTNGKVLDKINVLPTVAYSLRKLRTNYSGPAIEIRRETDNQTSAVGFDNEGNIASGLVSSFCGTSKCYVVKWYDQSGYGKDLSNPNNAAQPLIYNGSDIENVRGKYAIKFSGSTNFLRTTQTVFSNASEINTFTIAYAGYYSTIIQHGNGSGQGHMYNRREFAKYGFGLNSSNVLEDMYWSGATNIEFSLLTCRNSVSDNRRHLRRNGNNSASTNSTINTNFTNDILTVGGSFTGHIGEHIEYNDYINLAEVEEIENNQSVHFEITQPCLANSSPPSVPSQVFASSNTSSSASVSFIPSASAGSRPINYYEVTSSPDDLKATGSTSPIVVPGLILGRTYSFSVKAVNYCDETASATSNEIILGQIDAPSDIKAQKGVAEGSVIVDFKNPSFTNSQTITGYTVTSIPDNISVTGSGSPITVSGLSNIKKYTFQVVAHTATATSLPSLISNAVYPFTQILNDLPSPNAAFALRKLLATYNGPAIRVRRSDNATQDIGFLNNGELDETGLLAFVGSGDGFVATWYDQSGNNRNLIQTNLSNQPKIVVGGILARRNKQPTLNFYEKNQLVNQYPMAETRAFHSVWNAHSINENGKWGMLLGFTPNLGNGGIYFTGGNSTLVNVNNYYGSESLFINGIQTSNFSPIRNLKCVTTATNNHAMPAGVSNFRIGNGLDYYGQGFGNISTFMMFGNNLSTADRVKLDQREAACFEISF